MRKRSITLGLAISLSGRYALQGRQCLAGLDCYRRDVNATGGIALYGPRRRVPVDLRVYDDASSAARARRLATRLIEQDRIDLLLGPYGSQLSRAVAEVAEAHGTVLWNHSGAADAIWAGSRAWVVGILTPASRYLCAVLDLIRAVDPAVRRVALLHAHTGFAGDVTAGVRAWIEREGWSLVVDWSYRPGLPDFGPVLSRLARDPPDLLLGVGRIEDDLRLARPLCTARPRVRAIGLVAAGIDRFRTELREQAEGFLAPSQWEACLRHAVDCGPTADEFRRHYLATASVPVDYPAAQAYAAGLVAQRCVEAAGSLEPGALRAAAGRLRFTTFHGPYAIEPESGRQLAHPMLVTQWQRGRRRVVWPPALAEAEPVYPHRW